MSELVNIPNKCVVSEKKNGNEIKALCRSHERPAVDRIRCCMTQLPFLAIRPPWPLWIIRERPEQASNNFSYSFRRRASALQQSPFWPNRCIGWLSKKCEKRIVDKPKFEFELESIALLFYVLKITCKRDIIRLCVHPSRNLKIPPVNCLRPTCTRRSGR